MNADTVLINYLTAKYFFFAEIFDAATKTGSNSENNFSGPYSIRKSSAKTYAAH